MGIFVLSLIDKKIFGDQNLINCMMSETQITKEKIIFWTMYYII